MNSKPRTLFAILFGVPLLLLVPAWIVGSSVYQAGSIEFSVHEKGPHGCQVSGKVPAILVPAAMHFAPTCVIEDARREMECEIGDALEIVRAATRELARCPDGVIEAIESTMDDWWAIGTQFHPQSMSASALDLRIFEEFVAGITGEVVEMRMVA